MKTGRRPQSVDEFRKCQLCGKTIPEVLEKSAAIREAEARHAEALLKAAERRRLRVEAKGLAEWHNGKEAMTLTSLEAVMPKVEEATQTAEELIRLLGGGDDRSNSPSEG